MNPPADFTFHGHVEEARVTLVVSDFSNQVIVIRVHFSRALAWTARIVQACVRNKVMTIESFSGERI